MLKSRRGVQDVPARRATPSPVSQSSAAAVALVFGDEDRDEHLDVEQPDHGRSYSLSAILLTSSTVRVGALGRCGNTAAPRSKSGRRRQRSSAATPRDPLSGAQRVSSIAAMRAGSRSARPFNVNVLSHTEPALDAERDRRGVRRLSGQVAAHVFQWEKAARNGAYVIGATMPWGTSPLRRVGPLQEPGALTPP